MTVKKLFFKKCAMFFVYSTNQILNNHSVDFTDVPPFGSYGYHIVVDESSLREWQGDFHDLNLLVSGRSLSNLEDKESCARFLSFSDATNTWSLDSVSLSDGLSSEIVNFLGANTKTQIKDLQGDIWYKGTPSVWYALKGYKEFCYISALADSNYKTDLVVLWELEFGTSFANYKTSQHYLGCRELVVCLNSNKHVFIKAHDDYKIYARNSASMKQDARVGMLWAILESLDSLINQIHSIRFF